MDNITHKIKSIRKAEGLTQKGFAEAIGIPDSSLKTIESRAQKTINSGVLIKIINHPRFSKYSMYLTADEPEVEIDAQNNLDATTEDILNAMETLPPDLKMQAETMAKMLLLEQKTNLIDDLSKQVSDLKQSD